MKFSKETLDEGICRFFSECAHDDEVVIGVLRYGAHLPHLYQNACLERSATPKRIRLVLSHMLGFFPLEFYHDQRFLVVDDTVYEGTEMRRLLSVLTDAYNVPRKQIRTATLIAHEGSEFVPDCPNPPLKLSDAQYIAWKEELATLVRRDIRPTERDHPLYYVEGEKLKLNQFLSVIEQFGNVHPVGDDWDAPVFRFSVTVDISSFSDLAGLPGVELDRFAKIRFYWREDKKGFQLTIAPIAFARVDLPAFLKESSALARLIDVGENFFTRIESSTVTERGKMLYYFATRGLAALIMHRLFKQVTQTLRQFDVSLRCVPPEKVDGFVNYIFPAEYNAFYASAFASLQAIISPSTEDSDLPLAEKWIKPENSTIGPRRDPALPQIYEILEYVVKDRDPAVWNGVRWTPASDKCGGVTVRELVTHFKDSIFVSAALDELLDSGLLRAKDEVVHSTNAVFERQVLPGGEYNAIHVSRIADTLRCSPAAIDPQLAMEEACELWGPY
jgi:hypothetical protein